MYGDLVSYEKQNGDSIDIAADPFGLMMREIVKVLACEYYTEAVGDVAYSLGKWVYLIDALDDFDKDKKKKNYNVFVNTYLEIRDKCSLIKEKQSELIFTFGALLAEIESLSKTLNYKFNHDLTDNVFVYGLKMETKRVMENKKCKNITKS
jgi:hypothetical protein